jgi:hypothetical protein
MKARNISSVWQDAGMRSLLWLSLALLAPCMGCYDTSLIVVRTLTDADNVETPLSTVCSPVSPVDDEQRTAIGDVMTEIITTTADDLTITIVAGDADGTVLATQTHTFVGIVPGFKTSLKADDGVTEYRGDYLGIDGCD